MLAAPAFAAAALGRRQEVIFPVGRRVVLFTEVQVHPGSAVIGQLVADLHRAGSVRVLAVGSRTVQQGVQWTWEIDTTRAQEADRIAVAATRAGLARLLLASRTPRRP